MKLRKISGVSLTFSNFPGIKRPEFIDALRWPVDLTQLTAQNISELHGKYTQLYAYANQELSRINVKIIELETRERLRRNYLFRVSPSMNSQERWRRDAVLDSDTKIEEIAMERDKQRMARVHTEMFVANYEKYLNALSRELSRKTHESSLRRL